MGSPNFRSLDIKTQTWQRRGLEWVCERAGTLPVAQMEPRHVRTLRNDLQATPEVSRAMLKSLRALFRWATELDKVRHNPAAGVEALHHKSDGHKPWSAADREAFKKRHEIGTLAYRPTRWRSTRSVGGKMLRASGRATCIACQMEALACDSDTRRTRTAIRSMRTFPCTAISRRQSMLWDRTP